MTDTAPSGLQAERKRENFALSVLRNPLGLIASILILIAVLMAVLAPFIAPYDPGAVKIFLVNTAPGDGYLLGGDSAGRDILSRLVFGARNTLLGSLIAVVVAVVIGVAAGLFGGYYGRRLDVAMSWIFDALMALPPMIILLALFQAMGSSIYLSMVAFGVMLTPNFYRLTRSLVLGVKNELYIDAARVSGLSDLRIITRHILLVIRAPVVIQISIVLGIAIVIQAGLEFLGFGDPRIPTWGGMLQDAFQNIYIAPLALIWPGVAIAITVASFVLLANAIRDRMQLGGANAGEHAAAQPEPGTASSVSPAPVNPDVLLDVRNLSIGYPDDKGWIKVVDDISFQVHKGEVLGLVGESGSGKTQTAFGIMQLLSPGGRVLSGSAFLDGQDLTRLNKTQLQAIRGKRIAYVPQEPMSNLDPTFRIGFQLVEPMVNVLGISRKEAKSRALALLARVGLPDPERTFRSYPHQVSGGMAQRVLIAGAVSCNPDLLIADEPTTALDVTVQAEVLDLMRDLQVEFQMSMILVTHNFGVVADSCDRVAVMKDGRIVEMNEVHQLFAEPKHAYTRMLLDAVLEDSEPRSYTPPASGELSA